MVKKLIVSVLLGFLFISTNAMAYSMDEARGYMADGDYQKAAQSFHDVYQYGLLGKDDQIEAFYYWGFCLVKANEPQEAKKVFGWFLQKYDDGVNNKYIPDAMYVLGRIYEQLNEKGKAVTMYKKCMGRYKYNKFSRLCRKRLVKLGIISGEATDPFDDDNNNDNHGNHGSYHHGHHNNSCSNHHYSTEISQEVKDAVKKAKEETSSYYVVARLREALKMAMNGEEYYYICKQLTNQNDIKRFVSDTNKAPYYSRFSGESVAKIIKLSGIYYTDTLADEFLKDFFVRECVSGTDIVALVSIIDDDNRRTLLIERKVANCKAFTNGSFIIDDYLELAKLMAYEIDRDEFLLKVAQKCPLNPEDYRRLAAKANSDSIKDKILNIGIQNSKWSEMSSHTKSFATKDRRIKLDSNPFENNFKFDNTKIERINNLVRAVVAKHQISKAEKALTKSDKDSPTVKYYLKQIKVMQTMDNLYNEPRK